jgi:ribosome biogenesis GTPase
MHGLVIKNVGSSYWVLPDTGTAAVECKIKGTFRMQGLRTTNPIAVGDRVGFEERPGGVALITAIDDRRNIIVRRASNLSRQSHILASNVDLAALVVTINYPETSTVFIDRFLAGAESYGIPSVLIFNKTDRYREAENRMLAELTTLYESLGYPCHSVSALHDEGIDGLRRLFAGNITLLSGNSGVGKSTIVNAIRPGVGAKTGEISVYHNKGMHTTTFSEMIALEEGGFVIDTPGIKGFGLTEITAEEAGHYFREIFAASPGCRFYNCTHTHEPGCAVIQAVEEGRIHPSRYTSYLSIIDESGQGKYR